MSKHQDKKGCLLFDWGGTLMVDFLEFDGPMYTWPKVALVENVAEALSLLHEDWYIVLGTNARASTKDDIKRVLDRVKISQYIDEIYCFNSVGYLKPSAKFFEYILNDLNIDRSRLIMIGDNLENDVWGARDAGILAIWFNASQLSFTQTDSCKMVQNFLDLPRCLNELVRK